MATHNRNVIFQAYLHCLAFALTALGGVSLAAFLALARPARQDLVLMPDSAILTLCAGATLLAAARGLHKRSLLAGLALIALAGYHLGHNVLAGGSDHGHSLISGYWRVRSELAIISCLFGLAMILAVTRQGGRWLSQLCGIALIGLALLSQLSLLAAGHDLPRFAFRPESGHIANLFIALLGAAVLMLCALPEDRRNLLDRRSLVTGGLGALATCFGWLLLSLNELATLNAHSQQLLLRAQSSIENTLTVRLQLMQRMAERWQSLQGMPPEALWQQEAGSHLRDFPNLNLIAVLDARLEPVLQAGRDHQADGWLARFLAQDPLRDWLQRVRQGSGAQMSATQSFIADDDSTLVATPLRVAGQPTALLVASLNIGSTLDRQLGKGLDGFVLEVFEGPKRIYDSGAGRQARSLYPVGEQSADLGPEGRWRMRTYQALPRADYAAVYLPPLFMLFGLGFTFFLVISQRLSRLAIERSQRLRESNRELELSLQHQARLQLQNQRIMDHSMDVLCSMDEAERFTQVSPSCHSVLGYRPEEMIGRRYIEFVLPEDRERTRSDIQAIIQGESWDALRNRCQRKDGSLVHLLWSASWLESERTLFAVAHDITSLVRHEAYAEDQRDILSMISTDQPLPDILKAICLMSETLEPTALCSVLLVDAEHKRLLPGAAPSLPEAYNQALDGLAIGPLAGACGTAVFRRQMVVSGDISEDPLWHEHRDLALRHGLRACWAIPLISHHGDVLGTFAVHLRHPSVPDDEALQLIGTAGQLAAIAIERQHDRLRLQESEQHYRSLFTFNPAPVFSFDREGRFLSLNQAACELIDYSATELIGRPFSKLVPAEDAEQVRSRFLRVLDGQAQHYEVRCQTRDGGLLELDFTNLPIVVAEKIVGVFGIAKDITRAKKSEKQLRILQRSIEASYNGALICDATAPDLPIIYVNPAFERITGYSADEALGRNCRFLQGTDREQAGIAEIRHALTEKREVHVVLRNFRKDGTAFWNDLYIAPVPDEHGEITHFIGVQNDISEQKRVESELAYNASHDVLTGLPNRSLLEDRLRQGCQISQRYQRKLAVMFIDLDGFKPINDSMGHGIGDQILVEVARRLSQQVRPGDTVARLGGDEFILILPDLAREEDVLQVAERVIDCIARPYPIAGSELHITASLGIALSEKGMQQPMQLIQQADLAMYKAKQQGRNCYQWYTTDLEQKVSERVTLRNELQKAIEANAFMLYYQPQIDGRNGRVTGYEALLRWQHPLLGFISPAQFVPVAEDTGQIIPLSEWVLATACRDCRELLDRGMTSTVVAVNISAVHFQRNIFVDSVRRILEETRLPAELLELEITETVLLDNAERAIATLQALKALGVRLSIDDFGTGFSSLNYLKRLPIDKVKIDRAFVQEIISDRHDAAITQGIISMAHHLRLRVIAEGVESESQFAFLKKSHCDEFQGYYFARPMPFDQLEQFLHEHHKSPAAYLETRSGVSSAQTLLLLDDEENILRALTRVLRRDGYQIFTATRAQDAFAHLAKHDIQVILSDQRMPEMNGTEFLSRVKDLYPDTIRIVLSGYTDLKSVTDAINQGAIYKFLTKPWDDDQLRAVIAQAFVHHSMAKAKEENATVEGDGE
ncbi:Regulator of RpoS [compost metagenome]